MLISKLLGFALLALSQSALAQMQLAAAEDAAPLSNLSRPPPAYDGPAHEAAAALFPIAMDPLPARPPKYANFEHERATHQARHVADWVVDSGDNRNLPFAIVDKKDARIFVFDAEGRLRGAAPALLGLALGDDAVPGIGVRPLSGIRPEERTTPAGRFVASLGRNISGKEILWVDYDGAVSLHPVIKGKPEERRAQRLTTPTPLDNRISYGCINVPVGFFANVVRPAFTGTDGIVYVLPETRSAREVFASYDTGERARPQPAGPSVPAPAASPGPRQ